MTKKGRYTIFIRKEKALPQDRRIPFDPGLASSLALLRYSKTYYKTIENGTWQVQKREAK